VVLGGLFDLLRKRKTNMSKFFGMASWASGSLATALFAIALMSTGGVRAEGVEAGEGVIIEDGIVQAECNDTCKEGTVNDIVNNVLAPCKKTSGACTKIPTSTTPKICKPCDGRKHTSTIEGEAPTYSCLVFCISSSPTPPPVLP
jgi:hypothetical protein